MFGQKSSLSNNVFGHKSQKSRNSFGQKSAHHRQNNHYHHQEPEKPKLSDLEKHNPVERQPHVHLFDAKHR